MIQSLLLIFTSNSGNANASSYTKDNLVSRYKIDGSSSRYIDYSYDGLNRLTKKSFVFDSTTKNTEYTYWDSNRGGVYSTTQLDTEKLDNVSYKYYYDNVGNITSITKNSGAYRSYTYDNKNQLTKEVNSTSGITTSFTYDSLGNITKKVESGNSNKTINYSYGNNGKTGWNNLLTGVDLSGNGVYESNETISYDNIGNPTTYLGASLTWFGRQLKSYTKDGMTISYTYDADGLRTSQSIPSMSCTYQYVGGQLRYETRGDHKFYYFYDPSGNLASIRYCDANGLIYTFYALTNAQGDVIAFYNESGTCVVTYEYDAWGNVVKKTDTSGINFSEINMIRYRGYYYDSNSGLYYLQSRYYNPKVGRFLNADSQIAGIGGDVTGYNMFSYCQNNPINTSDPTGHWPKWVQKATNWFNNNIIKPVSNFFNPNTNTISASAKDGIFKASGSLSAGYSESNTRIQHNASGGKQNGMLGIYEKMSMGNTTVRAGIGNDNLSISLKGVGDALTVSTQAGLQYKDGFGVAAKAKAAVLSGRATTEFDIYGWQVEVGVSGDLLSIGAEAMIGVFPNEGFTAKASAGAGLFGAGFVFRIKAPQ